MSRKPRRQRAQARPSPSRTLHEVDRQIGLAEARWSWRTAVAAAVISGVLGLLGVLVGQILQSRASLDVERVRLEHTEASTRAQLESALIVEAIKSGDSEEAKRKLRLLVDAGLLSDSAGRIARLESGIGDRPDKANLARPRKVAPKTKTLLQKDSSPTDRRSTDAYGLSTFRVPGDLVIHGTPTFRIPGDLVVDGNISASYQDVAEWVESDEILQAGTVVTIDTSGASNRVRASTHSYDTRVAGAVSEQPGLVLGEAGEGKVLVAQSGRVRVKVDASYGPIRPGDLLVTSPTPCHAMRSQPRRIGESFAHMPGTILGKALEALEGGTGQILVLLTLQ